MRVQICKAASKWVGYLEHQTEELLGVYDANVGKGGCTVFADIVRRHYPWRNFMGAPWCAVFVYAIYILALGKEQAEGLLGKPHPGTKVMYRRMRRKGRIRDKTHTPMPGDIMFLANDGTHLDHVAIVVGVEHGEVITVEGNTVDPSGHFAPNQGGAVDMRRRAMDEPKILHYADMEM